MLFAVWTGEPHRATWDLDLLGRGVLEKGFLERNRGYTWKVRPLESSIGSPSSDPTGSYAYTPMSKSVVLSGSWRSGGRSGHTGDSGPPQGPIHRAMRGARSYGRELALGGFPREDSFPQPVELAHCFLGCAHSQAQFRGHCRKRRRPGERRLRERGRKRVSCPHCKDFLNDRTDLAGLREFRAREQQEVS